MQPQFELHSNDQLRAELAKLQAESKRLKAMLTKELSLKVSAKGAVSVYGMGRFPTTLYASQWDQLIAEIPRIAAFIKANRAILSTKPE